eukprot:357281-Chlamydomonas_euryale.AAC.23
MRTRASQGVACKFGRTVVPPPALTKAAQPPTSMATQQTHARTTIAPAIMASESLSNDLCNVDLVAEGDNIVLDERGGEKLSFIKVKAGGYVC